MRQGITVYSDTRMQAVRSQGGWSQATFRVTRRASLNLFAGQQDDRNSDLLPGSVGKNLAYGSNIIFRLGPNVLASFETSQTRTSYIGSSTFLNRHYDIALAYSLTQFLYASTFF